MLTIQSIRETAQMLLDQNEQFGASVDLNVIADSLNISIIEYDMSNVNNQVNSNISGFLRKTNGKLYIFVNEHETPARKRFTIAHELGHYLDAQLGLSEVAHLRREFVFILAGHHRRVDLVDSTGLRRGSGCRTDGVRQIQNRLFFRCL